jgi:hypothetical protein
VAATVSRASREVLLTFDPTEAITNLQHERYVVPRRADKALRAFYYSLRPLLAPPLRKLIQRFVVRDRFRSQFPAWPIDCSVEEILESLMVATIETSGVSEIPFIWFWPDAYETAAMLTHDVEDELGKAHCGMLMDLDDSFGVKAAFQIIPEGRYRGVEELVAEIRGRGFEANIHDLDHDGRLYDRRERFEERALRINTYARRYRMSGFRAGAMHRNQQWLPMLDFEYDMSVPNVAHLEPQAGGCCTVMPYFVGDLLELPLTTAQDFGLFYILGDYSLDLWRKQIETILSHHGLISFIIHPDYVVGSRERALYGELLAYITHLRNDRHVWVALPNDINRWWRQRRDMRLVAEGHGWRVEGDGRERARVAYARVENGKLAYRIAPIGTSTSGNARHAAKLTP